MGSIFTGTLTATLTLAACLLSPAAALAEKPTRAGLSSGKIYVNAHKVKGTDSPEMRIFAVVEAPPERIWPLVSNCNQFSRTMPRISKGRILSRKGNVMICRVTVDVPFPLSDLTSTTRNTIVTRASEGYYARHWKLISGDYTRNRGSYIVSRFDNNPKRSLVRYVVYVEPKTSVPTWLRSMAQKKSLPKMIRKIRGIAKRMGW